MRLTLSISRQQEFAADRLAASVVGGRHLIDGLKIIHAAGDAFMFFIGSEVAPALKKGYRPPMAEGFKRFLAGEAISTGISTFMSQELAEGKADPYDSHPALRERIVALGEVGEEVASNDGSDPALSLIRDVDVLESQLMRFIVSDYANKGFKPLSWDEMPEKVWIPLWRDMVWEGKHRLKGLTAAELPELLSEPSGLAVKMGYSAYAKVTNDKHRLEAAGLLGGALVLAFVRQGWSVQAGPGEPVRLERDGRSFRPFGLAEEFNTGVLKSEEWKAICEEYGVKDLEWQPEKSS